MSLPVCGQTKDLFGNQCKVCIPVSEYSAEQKEGKVLKEITRVPSLEMFYYGGDNFHTDKHCVLLWSLSEKVVKPHLIGRKFPVPGTMK